MATMKERLAAARAEGRLEAVQYMRAWASLHSGAAKHAPEDRRAPGWRFAARDLRVVARNILRANWEDGR